ncbi:aldo/keto reductase [Microbacterium sp. YY-01]|uniref:aldo/keto reductase n=1 Tax=Microbacterium sp. YY-01 TaxID=3421634 RepID=UPI003D163C80
MNTVSVPITKLASGTPMPLIGYGTHPLRGEDAARAVTTALEVGYRSVDTATRYRNEDGVGEGVRRSGVDRGEVFLTTKLPPDAVGRERETLAQSLKSLRVDYVDLWLIHWPPGGSAGVKAWEAMIQAREEGLVRAIGVSNYSLRLLDVLHESTGVYPEVNQRQWSPVHFTNRMLRGCHDRGVVVGAHSPFRSARLDDPVLSAIAGRYGVSPRQVIVRWNVQHGVAVVPKSAHRERMAVNLAVDFTLTDDEMRTIDELSEVG